MRESEEFEEAMLPKPTVTEEDGKKEIVETEIKTVTYTVGDGMGELEKRINSAKFGISHLDYVTEDAVAKIPLLNWVEEAKKEFPDTTEITQAFTMISNLFPESHAFSKRHLEKFMTKLREATIKWFMESADGEKQ